MNESPSNLEIKKLTYINNAFRFNDRTRLFWKFKMAATMAAAFCTIPACQRQKPKQYHWNQLLESAREIAKTDVKGNRCSPAVKHRRIRNRRRKTKWNALLISALQSIGRRNSIAFEISSMSKLAWQMKSSHLLLLPNAFDAAFSCSTSNQASNYIILS